MKRNKDPYRLLPSAMLGAARRGELLARFLNEPAASLSYGRVVEVFQLCKQLGALEPSSRLASNTRRAINAHLSELLVVAELQENGEWSWKAGHPGRTRPTEVNPILALKVISELASSQRLERMRECQACTNWFFAQTAKKMVCSDACRFAKFKQLDPLTYKQSRAEYMRQYRKARSLPGVKKKWMKKAKKSKRSR